jgi:radical SAM superfamily enzyme YgiQ (UPF0313 family)
LGAAALRLGRIVLSGRDVQADGLAHGEPTLAIEFSAGAGPIGTAVSGFVSQYRPGVLFLDVPSDDMIATVRAVSGCGLPLVLAPPVAVVVEDLDVIRSIVDAAGVPAMVGHRLPFQAGLLRIAALCGNGYGQRVTRFELRLRAGLGRMQDALDSVAAFDRLFGHVTDALSLLSHMGIPTAGLKISNTIDPSYWGGMRLGLDAGGGLEGHGLLVPGGSESLKLVAPDMEVDWRLDDSGEHIEVRAGRRVSRTDLPPTDFPGGLVEAFSDLLGRGLPLWEGLDTLSSVLPKAIELVDEYLHENSVAVRASSPGMVRREGTTTGDAFWDAFTPTRMGQDWGLTAQPSAAAIFLKPLETAFPLLLVRVPLASTREIDVPFPPLALARLAGMAACIGGQTVQIDLACDFEPGPEVDLSRIDLDAMCARLSAESGERTFELAGFSIEDPDAWPVVEALARHVKAKGIATSVVVGGRGLQGIDRSRVAQCRDLDFLVQGEGELPLLRLMQFLRGLADEASVPGLWRTSWPLDRSANAILVADLSLFPTPDFAGTDLTRYASLSEVIGTPFLSYLFILGCPQRCAFCSNTSSQKARTRPVADVVNDLRVLRDRHGVRDFYFLNNMINTSVPYMRQFLTAMESADLGIRWCDCARPAALSREDVVRLARVGCVELTWGVDAATQRLADFAHKASRLDKTRVILRDASEAGIRNIVNLIVGLPSETEDDFLQTMQFVSEMDQYVASFRVMNYSFQEGSPFRESPRLFGLRRRADRYDELGGVRWAQHEQSMLRRSRMLSDLVSRLKRAKGGGD